MRVTILPLEIFFHVFGRQLHPLLDKTFNKLPTGCTPRPIPRRVITSTLPFHCHHAIYTLRPLFSFKFTPWVSLFSREKGREGRRDQTSFFPPPPPSSPSSRVQNVQLFQGKYGTGGGMGRGKSHYKGTRRKINSLRERDSNNSRYADNSRLGMATFGGGNSEKILTWNRELKKVIVNPESSSLPPTYTPFGNLERKVNRGILSRRANYRTQNPSNNRQSRQLINVRRQLKKAMSSQNVGKVSRINFISTGSLDRLPPSQFSIL